MLNDESNSFVLPNPKSAVDLQLHFSQPARPNFLSIVMPVYDDCDGLKITLESLLTPTADRSRFEIVVGNDGADAKISALCQQYGVKEVPIRPNGGSYNARNRAIEAASGEFIGLIDADQVISPGWMDAVFTTLANADFIAGPVLLNAPPKPSPVEVYQIIFQPPADPKQIKDVPNALFFPTANVALRRHVLEELGGFDFRFRSAGDYEFSHRVTSSGRYRQGYSKEMKVWHPCRSYRQIIQRDRRTHYGELSLLRLYPDRFQKSQFSRGLTWRLLLPDLRLLGPDILSQKLGWGTYLRLFFLMWWIKLCRFGILWSTRHETALATSGTSPIQSALTNR